MASPSPCSPARILVVDDEPQICDLLYAILTRHGYACRSCGSVEAACALLGTEPFDLVITDYQLPGRSGLDLLAVARAKYPDIAFLMATGADNARTAVDALHAGALDYLVKPLRPAHVLRAVEAALTSNAAHAEQQRQQREAERAHRELELLLALRTQELGGALERARGYTAETLQFIAATLDARAQEVAGHSMRVCRYTLELAHHLGYSSAALARIECGAQLHDIGKLGIPDAILNKPGTLTPEETAIMRGHVKIGGELVSRVPSLRPAMEVIVAHHESYDGAGYPHGLAGDAIPMDARVFAVADTLDAMTSNRPYRRAQSWEAAAAEITRLSGRQFDPRAVQAFLAVPLERWRALQQG